MILEYYIFDERSQLGRKVLAALNRADKRGVQIHLRLDGIGSRQWLLQEPLPFQVKNGEISIFSPVPWPISRFLRNEMFKMDKFLSYWSHINRRNHKKLCIVDGHTAFVGSMNVDEHALAWTECGLMCDGNVVIDLMSSFFQLEPRCLVLQRGEYSESHFQTVLKQPDFKEKPEVLLQDSTKSRLDFRKRHRKAFKDAKSEITLVTPYFVPTLRMVKALIAAKKRGVVVSLILPEKLDHRFMKWLMDKYLFPLIHSGIHVYRLPGMVHAKLVIADDWMHVGSCNLNQRSLHLDVELNVQVVEPEVQKDVKKFARQLMDQGLPVTLDMLHQRPWFEKIMGTLLQAFRWML